MNFPPKHRYLTINPRYVMSHSIEDLTYNVVEHFDVPTFWSRVFGYWLEDPMFASRQGRKIFLFSEELQTVSGVNPATSSMGTQSPVYTCILDKCYTPSPSHIPWFTHLNNTLYFVRGRRHAVVQLVKTLSHKQEGRGFDPRLCHWKFLLI